MPTARRGKACATNHTKTCPLPELTCCGVYASTQLRQESSQPLAAKRMRGLGTVVADTLGSNKRTQVLFRRATLICNPKKAGNFANQPSAEGTAFVNEEHQCQY